MNDWIEWHGGECPVPHGTEVEVKCADGGVGRRAAGMLIWSHFFSKGDIVAYRVVKPAAHVDPELLRETFAPLEDLTAAQAREPHVDAQCGNRVTDWKCNGPHIGTNPTRDDVRDALRLLPSAQACLDVLVKHGAKKVNDLLPDQYAEVISEAKSALVDLHNRAVDALVEDFRKNHVPVDTKPSNPKDVIGSTKLDMGLVPDTAIAYAAIALTEGALKYGRYNWRVAGVRASIYRAACDRHLKKWWNGEECDPKTGIHHLANALACIAIILDADCCNALTDDRPPRNAGFAQLVDDLAEDVKSLQELFKDHHPHQYTIEDEA